MPKLARVERKTEYLPIDGEIKATNDQRGIIEGYLNYIGNVDFGDDRTMPGAFRKTLTESHARKARQNLDFLYPYLWNHDYSIPPAGGIFDADEDRQGLYVKVQMNMDTQMGRDLYASFKSGFLKKQSMGYRALSVDWVKEDVGDGKGVRSIRNLLEVQVMEGSCVVFPMNDLAQVDTVKNRSYFYMPTAREFGASLETKTVCGDTSGPIGPRDEAWNGAAAKKWIWSKALDSDGKVKAAVAKKYFMQVDGDPSLKTSYGYPFWNNDHISVGGVKAVAGALSGARNASPGGDGAGMRRKVATLYARINKKYPDDTPLVPPWGKGKTMEIFSKDYAESYQQTNQSDWISDLWNLWYPLRNEILTAFQTGDSIEDDVQKALDQFSPAVMAYVQQGMALNMTECMQGDDDSGGGGSMPMMMSSDDNPETKDGDVKLLSAASHTKMIKAVAGMETHIKEMKSELSRQRANQLQGYQVYSGNEPDEQKEDEEDEEPEQKDEKIEDVHTILHDLTLLLSADNANRGV